MEDRFAGRLTLADGEETDVELAFDDDTVALSIDGVDLGTWPLRFCRVSPGPHDLFMLSLDGEVVGFEPGRFRDFALAAAQRFRYSSLADRVQVIRELPLDLVVETPELGGPESVEPPARGVPWRFMPLALVLVVSGIVATLYLGGGGDADPPSVAADAVTTTAAAPSRPLFELTPGELVDEWNRLAPELGAPVGLETPPADGPFEVEVAPGLTLQGRISTDGTVDSLVMSAMSGVEDALLVPAVDVAIATADPRLDPDGRSQIMAGLGLPGSGAFLEDAETELGGVRYGVTRLEGIGSTLFTITRV